MGKPRGDVATEEPVVGEPEKIEVEASMSLAILPVWAIELANRWKKHNFNDLKLKFETGAAINHEYGPPTARHQRGQQTIQLLAAAIGTDSGEVSRMRNYALLADNYELFRAKHPNCTSWNAVKMLLAGKETSEERRIVEAIIGRIKSTTADLRKPKFALDEVDLDELTIELRKLARELASRTSLRLTVASVPTEAAA